MISHIITPKTPAVCDECGGTISIEEAALKTKRFSDGIQFDYFRCNSCGKVYVYLVTDTELRKDIRLRQRIASSRRMKLRAEELKKGYKCRIKDLPSRDKIICAYAVLLRHGRFFSSAKFEGFFCRIMKMKEFF